MLIKLHHVSLPCSNLETSRQFYKAIVGLEEFPRPKRSYEGAWFRLNDNQEFHLIHGNLGATYRGDKALDNDDVHFAFAVSDYALLLSRLQFHGYREDAEPHSLFCMIRRDLVGFAQVFIFDPDRHVIEFNSKYDLEDARNTA